MIKSPKSPPTPRLRRASSVQSPKSIKNVGLLFAMALFLTGCVTTQEYVYKEDTFRKEEQKVEENQSGEKKEEWIGSYLEKDNFIKQCPVCKRRYQGSLERCPYDGASLEKINQ